MPLSFSKLEGLGNDFVLVDERDHDQPLLPVSARVALCDRHRGVGADGVLTVLSPRGTGAIARMHLTNADGSVAEMCGNGLRCVALWLCDAGLARAGEAQLIDTDAGLRGATVLEGLSPDPPPRRHCLDLQGRTRVPHPRASLRPAMSSLGERRVRVDMGPARFEDAAQFAVPLFRTPLSPWPEPATTVSMGNPHVVFEVQELPSTERAARAGARIERDARFPERTNVEWAALRADGSVDVVVWERGVGLTQACGTGACAVVAALARPGLVPFDVDVTVRLPGGSLAVCAPKDGGAVWMTGPARRVFEGTWPFT